MKIAMFSWETLHSHLVGGVTVHVTELAAALERAATRCTPGRENRALLPVMMLKVNKQDYLDRLRAVIKELYGCEVAHTRTVSIHDVIEGKTAWKGKVEVFRLRGQALFCLVLHRRWRRRKSRRPGRNSGRCNRGRAVGGSQDGNCDEGPM